MNTELTDEILKLCKIGSGIALDDFNLLEKEIKSYKAKKYSVLKLYECILQSYLFCGFPAAIETLKVFRKFNKHFKIPVSNYSVSEFRRKGKLNCKLIYKKNYKKLIENMAEYSHDLKEWMIIEGYGKVLGRKGLTLQEREFINVSILSARFYSNQFYSHAKGLINLGVSKKDVVKLVRSLRSTIGQNNVAVALQIIMKF